jgi:pyruvate dehydrogenase E2 component (dihydrolipoamide acetyltransferase)
MTEVIMPKMGDGMEEGTLLEWLKNEGDSVKSGEVIGNIQTDKAVMELEAPGKGKLAGILVPVGETVPVGVPIAALLKDGESLPDGWGSGAPAAPAAEPEPAVVAAPVAAAPVAAKSTGRVKASPLAKKVAEKAGIEIAAVAGTGPGGRIVERDVRAAIEQQSTRIPAAPPVAAAAEDIKVPLNHLRGIIAQRTLESKQQVPHFYVTVEVDLERIETLRQAFKEEESGKVSVNDFVVKACAKALVDMPEANATYGGDHVLQFGSVNIGVAAAVDDGLLVPVVKGCENLTIRQISQSVRDLVGKARDGRLLPDEMQGSTFSISNMGMLNVDNFTAIINAPNAAIVAISTAKRVPVVVSDDEIEIRTVMNITGSFDHRVLDGASGAKFINIIRDYLESPTHLLS